MCGLYTQLKLDLIVDVADWLYQIPALAETAKPKWSTSWLEGFKSRSNIHKRKQHGEAASVNMEGAKDRMIELQAIIAPYPPKDVFNMDETGLFWKAIPDTTLATEA